jgi:uncharacterized damage-inducible protein DinB
MRLSPDNRLERMKQHFAMMAEYNRWANARLYNAAARLADELLRRPVGVYFKTLHGTLNHLLAADRIWMHRLDGTGTHPDKLDAIMFEEFAPLRVAREAEDLRIIQYVHGLANGDVDKLWKYRTLSGSPEQQRLRDILAHLFNHQTHHRGQAHAALTALGVSEPESLDLVVMQRQMK